MTKSKNEMMLTYIYDVLCGLTLPNSQNDEWATLKRNFDKDARKQLKKFIQPKNITLGNDYIEIGKRFKITLSK